MKKQIPLLVLSLFGLFSCKDSIDPIVNLPHSSNEPIISRSSIAGEENLPPQSTVLFYAKGALDIPSQVLTYSGTRWESSIPLSWNKNADTTSYTAIHPVYDDHTYSSSNLYANGYLEDVLIAQDTLFQKQDIELSFKHLFSKLTFQAPLSIRQQIKEIRLTVPATVTNISLESGSFTTSSKEYTSVLSSNESGNYPFILPPLENAELTLQLVMEHGTQTVPISPYTFKSNHNYNCKLKTAVGIYTAEDLIAFSSLINKRSNNDSRTLDEFGEKVGNDTIFYLMNDIALTEEECKRLLPIGIHNTYGFNYTFEGNNYTISNFTVPDKSSNTAVQSLYSGLFGYIGSKGIVRNLHISHSSSVSNPTCSQTGILSGTNYGMILNCSVSHSSISAGNNHTASGLICANNAGFIVNCFTQDCQLKIAANTKGGGIAGNATGHILNCYTYNNTFATKSTAASGGIAGMSNINIPLYLSNCYVYHVNKYNYFGSIIGYARGASIENAFYNNGTTYYKTTNSSISNALKYSNNFQTNDTPITTLLNEWIDTTGKNNYPDIPFKKWEMDESNVPRFK